MMDAEVQDPPVKDPLGILTPQAKQSDPLGILAPQKKSSVGSPPTSSLFGNGLSLSQPTNSYTPGMVVAGSQADKTIHDSQAQQQQSDQDRYYSHLDNIVQSLKLPKLLPTNTVRGVNSGMGVAKLQQEESDRNIMQSARKSVIENNLSPDVKTMYDAMPDDNKQSFLSSPQVDISNPQSIQDMTPAEMKHWQFMNTTKTGQALGGAGYIASGLSHSAVQVLKGVKQLADYGIHPERAALSVNPDADAFDSLDKIADLGLSENDKKNIEKGNWGSLIQTGKMVAGIVPLALGGEALGATKTIFALQGLGQATEQLDGLEKQGVQISPLARATYSTLSAATNAAFMGDLGEGIVSKLPNALRGRIVDGITAETMKETAGKQLSDAELKNALVNNINKWTLNAKQGGINFVKNWVESTKELSKFTLANYGTKKLTDAVNDKPIFNESGQDLIGQLGDIAFKQAPLLGAVGAFNESKLAPHTEFKDNVTQSIVSDPSHENVDAIKQQIANHGFDQNNPNQWTPQEMDATFKHIDRIADIAKQLPKGLAPEKQAKAVDLVLGRNDLQAQLGDAEKERGELTVPFNANPSNNEQLLTDKIDQANDKLLDIANDTKTTYSKGVGDEEGKFFKTTEGKKEEITPDRYELEKLERSPTNPKQNESETNAEKGNNEESGSTENGLAAKENEVTNTGGDEPPVGNEQKGETQDAVQKQSPGEVGVRQQGDVRKELGETDQPKVIADESQKTDDKKQKAIDLISHGLITVDGENDGYSPRIDLGMTAKDKAKGVADIHKGNYDTAPAKRLIENVMAFHESGDYPVIEGTGGRTGRGKSIPVSDMETQLAEAKAARLNEKPTKEELAHFNGTISDLGTTHEELKAHQQYEDERNQKTNTGATGGVPADVQRPENDAKGSDGKNTSSKAVQAEPGKSVLTDAEQTRRLELRKKFAGKFNSGVNPFDKEFYEYAGLVFKEAKGEFKQFAKTLIDEVGEKIKSSLAHLWEKSGGGVKDVPDEYKESEPTPTEEAIFGTKNAITKSERTDMGLPKVELPKHLSKDEGLAQGKQLVDSGKINPKDIINKALNGTDDLHNLSFSTNEENAMAYHHYQLGKEIVDTKKLIADTESPEDGASLSIKLMNLNDAKSDAQKASIIMGNVESATFKARQTAINMEGEVIETHINQIKDIYGDGNVPEAVSKELDELRKKYEDLQAKNAKIEKAVRDNEAAKQVKPKRTIFGTKKLSGEEFEKAKSGILADLEKAWKKSFTNTYITLPGIPQLNAIAPHIGKLLQLFANQGISKLDDVVDGIHGLLKDKLEGITKEDVKDLIAGKYSDKRPLSDIRKQINDLRSQAKIVQKISDLEKGIVAATRKKGESSPEVKVLQKQLAELKKNSPESSIEDIKRQIKAKQTLIDKGEFLKIPVIKRSWENNKEWKKNEVARVAIVKRLREMTQDAYDSKKTAYMRGLDWVNRQSRRAIFFLATPAYVHLSSSTLIGSFANRIPEQVSGYMFAKMFPALAEHAPIEGTTNAAREGQWYADFMNIPKQLPEYWNIIKSGESKYEKEFSPYKNKNHIPILDLLTTDTHTMIKHQDKVATFEAALSGHLQWYERNEIGSSSDPLNLETARQAAWARTQYELFQDHQEVGDKISSVFDAIKNYYTGLEKKGIETAQLPDALSKLKGNALYTRAFLYHLLNPINTVPVNMLRRALLPWRFDLLLKAKAENKALAENISNMTNKQADLLMTQLKKGNIGTFYWAAGFILAGTALGGNYTGMYSDKQRSNPDNNGGTDPYADFMNLAGIDISKGAQHALPTQQMQMAATYRMVYNHYSNDNGDGVINAMLKGITATGKVIADKHPVVSAAENLYQTGGSPRGYARYGDQLKNRFGVKRAHDILKVLGYASDDDDTNDK